LNKYLQQHPSTALSFLAPLIGVLAATLAGALMGAVLERLTVAPLRKRTRVAWVMNSFLLTAGISFILVNGTNLILGPNFLGIPAYYDFPSFQFLGMRIAIDRIMAFSIAVIVIAALTYFMQRTRTGRAIRAVSQDETGAELVGINLGFIHTLTFSLATAMAATAGATLLFMFQAYPTVGLQPNYYAWYVVMLVGMGNVYGAIVGGFIVALLQTATQQFFGIAWTDVIPTVVMILILIVVPSGVFGSEVKGILDQ
jgi:branched-chain amino acid transport system permease protein